MNTMVMNGTFFKLCLSFIFGCIFLQPFYGTEPEYWHHQERELRYTPQGKEFVIINGKIKYNRALYGNNSGFRVETGDVPEFAMYMPGMGGNIHFGLSVDSKTIWLNDCNYIESRFLPGKRSYVIQDPAFPKGKIIITALAAYEFDGIFLEISWENMAAQAQLSWIFGGATGRNFSRNGDLRADPADCFDLKPEYCTDNIYTISSNTFDLTYGAENKNRIKTLKGIFPDKTQLRIGDAQQQTTVSDIIKAQPSSTHPALTGNLKMENTGKIYICIYDNASSLSLAYNELKDHFILAEKSRKDIAERIKIETPDPFINTLGGIAAMAGDAIWDGNSFQHGAIGWRMPLNGWRGAYTGDVLGWHDRGKTHFSGYALSQVTEPLSGPIVMDTALHLTRAEEKMGNQMFSSGYICRNPGGKFQPHHYDMNLCYIDELLWHFNWTGDWEYVREMWPVIKRHLAWEKRCFDPDHDGLYDAYACIWASDALQYNSGGVTHSSSYNYRSNRIAAFIAGKLGEDPTPYQEEAEKIKSAVNSRLWMQSKGHWAEYIETSGNKQLHPSAGLWTIYHTIDSEIHDLFKAYQALRYVDHEIPHIPVRAKGLQDDHYQVVSTTDWMPYSWSVNNVAFAELMHTSLAYWQGARKEEAFHLWKSSILDAMYIGSSPGNIVQVCFYDAARGETYRDFADPVGMFSRSMVQGLFGIIPDMLNNKMLIKPGLPSEWDFASFETPDIGFDFKRSDKHIEIYQISPKSSRGFELEMQIPALKDRIKRITLNGQPIQWQLINDAIENPQLLINCGKQDQYILTIEWEGMSFKKDPETIIAHTCAFQWEAPSEILEIFDPQNILTNTKVSGKTLSGIISGENGHRTLFSKIKQGDFTYWKPVDLEIRDPFSVIPVETESQYLRFMIRNNTAQLSKCKIKVENWENIININPQSQSDVITVPSDIAQCGSNLVSITDLNSGKNGSGIVINWNLPHVNTKFTPIHINEAFNARVSDIFKQKYLSPRSPYTTLQIPWQGIGEWCHPLLTADIDEQGLLRSATKNNGKYYLPNGIPFSITKDNQASNIVYTSLWDNYPDSISVPLEGKASHMYLLMAGSTNHMQSRFTNGIIEVEYTDGHRTELKLINPENWCPIEQDYFHDGFAFDLKSPRPWRVYLKTGEASRDAEKSLGIEGVYTRQIEGGAATILDLPLNKNKALKSLTLRTTANEVIIGLMAITLVK